MHVRLVVAAIVAALSVFVVSASAESGDKATGGGQVLVSSSGGAGDTIAFTAQKTEGGGKGQVQLIDRDGGGTGKDATRFHGTVSCIEVESNTAFIAGSGRHSDGTESPFQLYVQDNGEPNQGNDIVWMRKNASTPSCDEDDFDQPQQIDLARGNAQVTDGD